MLLGPGGGMALKSSTSTARPSGGEPDIGAFDYATVNAPVFFCNTIEHYLLSKTCSSRQEVLAQGARASIASSVSGNGKEDPGGGRVGLGGAFRVLGLAQIRPVDLLLSGYWTIGAVRHRGFVAEIRLAPVPGFASRVARHALDMRRRRRYPARPWSPNSVDDPSNSTLKSRLCTDIDRKCGSRTLPSSGPSSCTRSSR